MKTENETSEQKNKPVCFISRNRDEKGIILTYTVKSFEEIKSGSYTYFFYRGVFGEFNTLKEANKCLKQLEAQ